MSTCRAKKPDNCKRHNRNKIQRTDNLKGAIKLTSIEGRRPKESTRPSAQDLQELKSKIETILKSKKQ